MNKPNFLVIGAAKSGTTSLYHYLNQHPDIYMSPQKELNFFALQPIDNIDDNPVDSDGKWRYDWLYENAITDLDAYHRQFDGVTSETAIGEASPLYLYSSTVPKLIRRYRPDMKLIVILRNPVDRAFSHYMQYVQRGHETLTRFSDAIDAEPIDHPSIWWGHRHFVRLGFYHTQLSRYYQQFGSSQIRVYLYQNFCTHPRRIMSSIFEFLEVDPSFVPDTSIRHNKGSMPQNPALHQGMLALNRFLQTDNVGNRLLRKMLPDSIQRAGSALRVTIQKKNLTKRQPTMSKRDRQRLITLYRDDILQLQDLLQRDLSIWLDDGSVQSTLTQPEFQHMPT
ncbi:MAG: sulfotransferase family protein [Elainellaceae cyanobacterium]